MIPAFLNPLRWFSPRRPHRDIFYFWDGQRERSVDPFEIMRAIEQDSEFNLERDASLMIAGDDEATQITVRCVRRAFAVKPFNEGGLLEAECLELIQVFYEFLSALKKNISGLPIESEPTDTATSNPPTAPGPIHGSSSSGSS
jgi:hypothetical protein